MSRQLLENLIDAYQHTRLVHPEANLEQTINSAVQQYAHALPPGYNTPDRVEHYKHFLAEYSVISSNKRIGTGLLGGFFGFYTFNYVAAIVGIGAGFLPSIIGGLAGWFFGRKLTYAYKVRNLLSKYEKKIALPTTPAGAPVVAPAPTP